MSGVTKKIVGSMFTRSAASNIEHVTNVLYVLANSASYLQWEGK